MALDGAAAKPFINSGAVTLEFVFELEESRQEFLIAELDGLGFDVFLSEPALLKAYITAPLWSTRKEAHLKEWLEHQNDTGIWKQAEIEARDWNEPWEKSIQPIVVPPFLIRPSWAAIKPEQQALIDIVVDPKMSFGTGHHESTRLVLRSLSSLIKSGHRVLDAGSGTAILAIAAAKLGASEVIAFDIDAWTAENAEENIRQNEAESAVRFYVGNIETVAEDEFDVLLANINRNVLLDYMPAFARKVKPEGVLVLAGLLLEDKPVMIEAAAAAGFAFATERQEAAWWSGVFSRAK